jgi:hypothetical protein
MWTLVFSAYVRIAAGTLCVRKSPSNATEKSTWVCSNNEVVGLAREDNNDFFSDVCQHCPKACSCCLINLVK